MRYWSFFFFLKIILINGHKPNNLVPIIYKLIQTLPSAKTQNRSLWKRNFAVNIGLMQLDSRSCHE